MERIKNIVFFIPLSFLLLNSCIKTNIRSVPIEVNKVYGIYSSHTMNETLYIYKDSTFCYKYLDNVKLQKTDSGSWMYKESHKLKRDIFYTWSTNELYLNTKDTISTSLDYITKRANCKLRKCHKFYVCHDHIFFGKIILTRGYQGDPDGAPALKWLHKVD